MALTQYSLPVIPVEEVPPINLDDPKYQLGQFIPPHYHYNMLRNPARMTSFRAAIAKVIKPGHKVLELGGGSGVLSCFAARQGATVRCVEVNPELIAMARPLLKRNGVDDRVELIEADAFTYLPPEPVDVVICEMIHTALMREKQAAVIASFKSRYRRRFGDQLPRFIPEGVISAVQPVQQNYTFFEYDAPGPVFLDPVLDAAETISLGEPKIYHSFLYESAFPQHYIFDSTFIITDPGTVNAVRVITKNLLAVLVDERRTIDWLVHYLAFPVANPLTVRAGDRLRVAFDYRAGDELNAVTDTLRVSIK